MHNELGHIGTILSIFNLKTLTESFDFYIITHMLLYDVI